MKKIYFLLLATILAASCKPRSNQSQNSNDKPVITVTLEPLRYFTEAIAGDHFTVVSMVPKGTSPETYDPTPQQLVDLAHSKAYFYSKLSSNSCCHGESAANAKPGSRLRSA